MEERTVRRNFHKGIASLVTAGGFVVVAGGVVTGLWTSWDDVWSSVFIEIGAGIALVALIVFFEDKIVHRQTAAVEERVEQRAEARQRALEDRIEEVATSVSNLNDRVEQARRTRFEAQDEAVRTIQENPTAANVAQALGIAADLYAIEEPLVVQASGDRYGTRVIVRQHLGPLDYPDIVDLDISFPGDIGPVHSKGFIHPGGTKHADATWAGDASPEFAIVALEEQLQRRNRYESGLLDAEVFFSNLIKTLDMAIQSRRRVGDHVVPLRGSVIEMYSDECFITTKGIECPSHQFFQEADESLLNDPPVPEFISPRDWQFLVSHAMEIFAIRPPAPNIIS